MAKIICEYKMHRDVNSNLTVPYFIEDGGYFQVGNKFIGVTYDTNEMYVPKFSLTKLTQAQLVTRVVAMDINIFGVTATTEEKTALVNSWWAERS